MKPFIAAAVQINAAPGDEAGNIARAVAVVEEAAARGASLICLPELCTTGYDLPAWRRHPSSVSTSPPTAFAKAAKKYRVHLIAGAPLRKGGKLYNCAFLWDGKGRLAGSYAKAHLMATADMPEHRVFTPGKPDGKVFRSALGNIGLMICYDLRFPELARKMALNGADIIAVPSAWPAARIKVFNTLLSARAIENQCHVLAANRAGADRGIRFGGRSALFLPTGEASAMTGAGESLLLARIDPALTAETRKRIPALRDRHERYGL